MALVALRASEDERAAAAEGSTSPEGETPRIVDLPFPLPGEGVTLPPSGVTDAANGLGGPSSRPGAEGAFQDRASASGSVLLSQVMGAADLMGYDVAIPDLPLAAIPTEAPLRAAILAWVASTGSVVDPEELATELLRADALPIELQRDIALLLFSAVAATELQRAALASIPPNELAWIYAHPEVAQQMSEGITNEDTLRMSILASLVDMEKSVAASLLMLQAIEVTRGSLQDARAQETLAMIEGADLDPTTRAILKLLVSANERLTDSEKLDLAAEIVALGAGISVPAAPATPTFEEALTTLIETSQQIPDAALLEQTLARASLLPLDLQGAIAILLLAEANAIRAADPATLTPTSQSEALAGMLVAIGAALPTLEKYNLYWTSAPDALRVTEWDPSARLGWVAHHTALVLTAAGDISDLSAAAALMAGHGLPASTDVPERSFVDAYLAIAEQGHFTVSPAHLEELRAAESSLAPAVRDAAALLMSASAESARLNALAWKDITPIEKQFLFDSTEGLDAMYGAPLTEAEQMRLAIATAIAARVDADALTASSMIAAKASEDALRMLQGADAFQTHGTATPAKMGLAGLLERLNPFGSARAQAASECAIPGTYVWVSCENDVVLRLDYPDVIGFTPGEYVAYQTMLANQAGLHDGDLPSPIDAVRTSGPAWMCNERDCAVYDPSPADFSTPTPGEATHTLLLITGQEGKTYAPETAARRLCSAQPIAPPTTNQGFRTLIPGTNYFVGGGGITATYIGLAPGSACRDETAFRYGAPTISIDLGGNDQWNMPVGVVHTNATIPVSLHIDVGGTDSYNDPSSFYDMWSPMLSALGVNAGHPSAGSAMFGGVAITLDAFGDDFYDQTSRSQGFGRLGFGMLIDLSGVDRREGGLFVQGASTETFSLGGGILFDAAGGDTYFARSGQGYGIGGILLDVGGDDRYVNDAETLGVPVVRLDIIPGGDVTALDSREDNRVWTSGPGTINVGLGIDQEIVISGGQGDSDGFPDLVEFIVGTDPQDSSDHPANNLTARAEVVLNDTDEDGYPNYIERAFSTDPDNGASYPAGLPANPVIRIPAAIAGIVPEAVADIIGIDGQTGTIDPLGDEQPTGTTMTSSDKIIDLRLPVQDAGSIDHACTGEFYPNSTAPFGIMPGVNLLPGGTQDEQTNGPARPDDKVKQHCVFLSYTSTGSGEGNASVPRVQADGDPIRNRNEFTFHMPAGILAIGDLVPTSYTDDYLVVIDLGGADKFTSGAGGGLLIQTEPIPKEGETPDQTYNNTFIIPSLVVSVDLPDEATGLVANASYDKYDATGRDFAQGSLFGVLVDTAGNDTYIARDGSQGSLGGVLLDLGSSRARDTYTAGHLSQGAGLASSPRRADMSDTPVTDVPFDGVVQNGASLGAVRRHLPGILLDFSAPSMGGNTFTAGANSQGFARGFSQYEATSPPGGVSRNATRAFGLLASIGESADTYRTSGRNTQGVGGLDGVGILVDRSGGDTYQAGHFISQGTTISQTVGTRDYRYSQYVPRPAAGILVDLNGDDTYKTPRTTYSDGSREARENTITLSHAESSFGDGASGTNSYGRLFLDTGVHLDINTNNPVAAIDGISGDSFLNDVDKNFLIHMPNARLAIGNANANVYAREYAFVVDLGGDNNYTYNQGGHIRDYIGQLDSTPNDANRGLVDQSAAPLNLFPVSFLLDAGHGNSKFHATGPFTQGASYFGVGILADLGGNDTFTVAEEPLPSIGSQWIDLPPIIDGSVGDDWSGVANVTINLTARDDERFASEWSLRIANDKRALYFALEGKTNSATSVERSLDQLFVDLDMGRQMRQFHDEEDRTGIDQVRFAYEEIGEESYACKPADRGARSPALTGELFPTDNDPTSTNEIKPFEAACRFSEDGSVVYEFRKEIITGTPRDRFDLDYCYVLPDQGFGTRLANGECDLGKDRLGLFLQFNDTGAGWLGGGSNPAIAAPFVYPKGATHDDGDYASLHNGRLDDEMAGWATIVLANLKDRVAPNVTRATTHTQGASLAGVGIVALLGNGLSQNEMRAGDRSQGYGEYSGLGLVFDMGGSDKYVGGSRVQGAAYAMGFGMLLDLEGNDNYVSRNESLGWTTTPNAGMGSTLGSAIFLDLGGDDQYLGRPAFEPYTSDDLAVLGGEGQLDQASSFSTTTDNTVTFQRPSQGNNLFWIQNASIGADYKITEVIRGQIAGKLATALYGSNAERTRLNITRIDTNQEAMGPWGNGCLIPSTINDVNTTSFDRATDKLLDYRADGEVCFVVLVDTSVDAGKNAITGVSNAIPAIRPETASAEGQLRAALKALAEASTDPAPPGTLDVRAIDLLVDRERVATTATKIDLSPTLSAWSAVVNLTQFEDGARRVKAMPQFVAEVEGHGAFLMYDDVQDRLDDEYASIRTLFVDNAPEVDLELAPRFRGAANATFSPYAIRGLTDEIPGLRVNYSVSRDSSEDRLRAATGWEASPWNSTFPCSRTPLDDYASAQLCQQIPFYLPKDDNAALTTQPGTAAVSTPLNLVQERYDAPYARKTVNLLDDFHVSLEESFHVVLSGRTSINQDVATTTRILLHIERPNGEPATDDNGQTWYLGDATRVSPPNRLTDISPSEAFGAFEDDYEDAYARAEGVVGLLSTGNIVLTSLETAESTHCTPSGATGYPCTITRGDWTIGQSKPCARTGPAPGSPVPNYNFLIWTAVTTLNNTLYQTSQNPAVPEKLRGQAICRNIWPDLYDVGEEHGTVLGGVTNGVASAAQGALDEVDRQRRGLFGGGGDTGTRQTYLNFEEFYFDANKSSPLPGAQDRAAGVRLDPDTNSIVIPRGYRLAFSVGPTSGGDGGIITPIADENGDPQTVGEVFTSVIQTIAESFENAFPAQVDEVGESIGFGSVSGYISNTVIRPNEATGKNIDQLSQAAIGVPAGWFYVGAGEPDAQSRLEIRSPTEPGTNVSVKIQKPITRQTIQTLVPAAGEDSHLIEGDLGRHGDATRTIDLSGICIPAEPATNACKTWNPPGPDGAYPDWWTQHYPEEKNRVNWSAAWMPRTGERWTQHNVSLLAGSLADGLYTINVSANDTRGKLSWHTDTVLVDKTAPRAWIKTSAFLGSGSLVNNNMIPLRWNVAETGSGVAGVYVYYKAGETVSSSRSAWTPAHPADLTPFPPSVTSHFIASGTSLVWLAVAIGVDEAGNVEGVTSASSLQEALDKAFAAKIKLGPAGPGNPYGYQRIFIDQVDPIFSSVDVEGGRLLTFKGAEYRFVRAGAPIAFSICASDAQSGINNTILALDRIDAITGNVTTKTIEATPGEACNDTGGIRYTASTWPSENIDSVAFPEGVWIASFEVFDMGGNRLRLPFEQIILDHASPEVDLLPPVLPTGQTAVKPGDLVKIRFLTDDNFGVDEAAIAVDASSLAKNATALRTRNVRIDGTIYQEASFIVDRVDLSNREYAIVVKVPDLAGNITTATTKISVDFKPFDFVPGSLSVSNVSHNGATLHWKTTENTSALAKFGTTLTSLTGRTPQDLNATLDHSFRVEGLKPSTHYYLRAVSVSAGGFTKESDIVEINTTSALFLDVLAPVKNDRVSGAVKIAFKGGLLDSTDFVTYTLEVRDNPTKPWTFVTTAVRQGDEHVLTWNSTRFLDATGYELRLTAEAGRDITTRVIGPITSDNTPPSVLVLTPLIATNDTTPTISAETVDTLAGLAPTGNPIQLLLDGEIVNITPTLERTTGGRIRVLYEPTTEIPAGIHAFELRVTDLAGNVAKEIWRVAIDGDAPIVTTNPTRFAPGTAAAKLGGTVTMNFTIKDLSGVAHVVADTSELSASQPETRLVKLVNTDNWQGTFRVTDAAASAIRDVRLLATDLAGNTRAFTLAVTLDNVAPTVAATSIAATGHRRLEIDVPANEPVLVNGTARAPNTEPGTAATTVAATKAKLVFDGLFPSRTYTYTLTVVDLAGNEVPLTGKAKTLDDTTPPSTVGPLSVVDLLNATLRLSWGAATDDVLVSHYQIFRSEDGITFAPHATSPTTTYEDWGLPYEKSYVYKVAAVDYGGNVGPADEKLRAAATAVPQLTVGLVTPTVGTTTTTFRYTLTYTSPGGVPAQYVRVILDGVPQNMTLESGEPKTGAVYVYETRLAPHKRDAPHTYAFETSDGRYTISFPQDGSLIRGPLVSGDVLAEGEAGGLAAFAQRVPLGGVAGVAIAMLVAVGLAALISRRKKEGSK